MLLPEARISLCAECGEEIPYDFFWRRRSGPAAADGQGGRPAWVLYSECPECGRRRSVRLRGPAFLRAFYGWLWQLRYPYRTAPSGFGS